MGEGIFARSLTGDSQEPKPHEHLDCRVDVVVDARIAQHLSHLIRSKASRPSLEVQHRAGQLGMSVLDLRRCLEQLLKRVRLLSLEDVIGGDSRMTPIQRHLNAGLEEHEQVARAH